MDRLDTFRRLCLTFALLTLAGVTATLQFRGRAPGGIRSDAAAAGIALAVAWIAGYRWRRFPLGLLPFELLSLLLVLYGMRDAAGVLAVCYTGVQFRALYRPRRDVILATVMYVGAFAAGQAFLSNGSHVFTPVAAFQALGITFCAAIMANVAEAFERDVRSTRALERSRNDYQLLFDGNPWAMWVFDPETLALLAVNEAALRQYGYSREEFLKLGLADLRPAQERVDLAEQIRGIRAGPRFATHLRRHLRRDGTIMEVEVVGGDIEFEGSHACLAVAVDVSQRESALRALRESEERFRSVAENLHEALVITDRDHHITYANPSAAELLGYDASELPDHDFSMLVPPEQRAAITDRVQRRLEGMSERYETELLRKDGTRIIADISASPRRDAAGAIVGTVGVISDVTERRQLEDELRQAHRLEAVGRLAGGIAHDFNNLLTVIKCHTELLVAEQDYGEHTREALIEVDRAADRATMLTRQLLAFSRRQLLQPRRVGLSSVVAQAEPLLRRLLQPGVELSVQRRGGGDAVWVDPLQLEHVLVVLVENARDAVPATGRVVIDTRAATVTGDDVVTAPKVPPGEYAVLTVSDNGAGMDDDVLRFIFEPFFTTKGAARRTGLGLASVYGIVKQSAGHIDVNSIPGIGTTFRIFLPLARDPGQLPARGALQTA